VKRIAAAMLEGFTDFTVQVEPGLTIAGKHGGSGPPLLLIHGYPQNHLMWHEVAPSLSQSYTLYIPDLRGYGQSSKPKGLPDHSNYSFRAMANDLVAVMKHFGHERFAVCGHDRGARTGHRMAVDHPDKVSKLMVLDIAPTLAMYEATDFSFARAYFHWFFMAQPYPLPEAAITKATDAFFAGFQGDNFHAQVKETYRRGLADWDTCHAMCEDYRAAAGIDLEHAREDIKAGRKVQCDVRCVWGKEGVIEKQFDPLKLWKDVCAGQVDGEAVPCGHFIPEHAPTQLVAHIKSFFT